jgi:hypothetical protein
MEKINENVITIILLYDDRVVIKNKISPFVFIVAGLSYILFP